MPSFNQVILVGNLTRDVELRYTPKGMAIAKLNVAINRTWRNEAGETKEEVTFVEVDAFGRTAENIGQYLSKGRPVLVEGRLKLDQWDDKTTGAKRQKLGVICETCQFLGTKPPGEKPEATPRSTAPAAPENPLAKIDPEDVPPHEGDDVPF